MSKLLYSIHEYTLRFAFDARTSRGKMTEHRILLLKNVESGVWAEIAPLPGLSPDYLAAHELLHHPERLERYAEMYPSVRFGWEQLHRIPQKETMVFATNAFTAGKVGIPINGLVWMADVATMYKEAEYKIQCGFQTIKLKIGAYDWSEERRVLEKLRRIYAPEVITIRVDANGAYTPEQAKYVLDDLKKLHIHSVEQPIKAGQWEAMHSLCRNSPVPIALDEELIGLHSDTYKKELLECIKPTYLILKPTLVGGLEASAAWIRLAEEAHIGWWVTSALESAVGLNHIAQWVSEKNISLPQGLGTGAIYSNPILSPLEVKDGKLWYNTEKEWNFSVLESLHD